MPEARCSVCGGALDGRQPFLEDDDGRLACVDHEVRAGFRRARLRDLTDAEATPPARRRPPTHANRDAA